MTRVSITRRLVQSLAFVAAALLCQTSIAGIVGNEAKPIMLPSVEFHDVTLTDAIAKLQKEVSEHTNGRDNVNYVIHTDRLTSGETRRRISFRADEVTVAEVVYAICRASGAGYRIEPHAIVISSRSHVGLPLSPSKRAAAVPDGAAPKRFFLFRLLPK